MANFLKRLEQKAIHYIAQKISNNYPLGGSIGFNLTSSSEYAGQEVNETAAMRVAAWNRGIRYICESIEGLPWDVYFKGANNARYPHESDLDFYLNNQANDEITANRWRLTMLKKALDHGNAYAEVGFDGKGAVAGLGHPIEHGRCYPFRDRDDQQIYYRVHHAPWDRESGYIDLPQWKIFHLAAFGDGLIGVSLAAWASHALGISMAQDQNVGAYFANGSRASGVLEKPTMLTLQKREELAKHISTQLSGDKAFSVLVLEKGETWNEMKVSNTDAQLFESRQFSVLELARFLGLPPHVLMDYNRATWNNVEQANIEAVTSGLMPWTVRLEREANFKLIRRRDRRRLMTKINLAGLLRADFKTQMEGYQTGISWGWWNRNYVRGMLELPPVEGLDTYLIPANMLEVQGGRVIPPNRRPETLSSQGEEYAWNLMELERQGDQEHSRQALNHEAEEIIDFPWHAQGEQPEDDSEKIKAAATLARLDAACRVCEVVVGAAWQAIQSREVGQIGDKLKSEKLYTWARWWLKEKHKPFVQEELTGAARATFAAFSDESDFALPIVQARLDALIDGYIDGRIERVGQMVGENISDPEQIPEFLGFEASNHFKSTVIEVIQNAINPTQA